MLSNTPYRGYKAHTFEGGISSPLRVSWPKELSGYCRQFAARNESHYRHSADIPGCGRRRFPVFVQRQEASRAGWWKPDGCG